jgi:hypothetical protein
MRALGVLIVFALLAGCGGDEPAAVPQGFVSYDGVTFTFAYPKGYSKIRGKTSEGMQGPRGTSGLAPQVAVGSGQSPAVPMDLILDGFRADNLTRRANWKIVRQEDVEVEGAKEAKLTEARYDEVTGDTTTPVRTIDIHARTEDGMLYDFFVRAPEADFDRERLRETIDTFRIE